MNVFIDIETIPQQPEEEARKIIAEGIKAPATMKKPETIQDWHEGRGKYAGDKEAAIEDVYRRTSFDGSKGQVCSIAFAVDDSAILSSTDSSAGEAGLLKWFVETLSEYLELAGGSSKEPFFIGHYVGGFDLKFLFHRLVINSAKPGFKLPFNGRHGQHYYDTMAAWAGYKDRISQDALCKALGIEGKPKDIDGSKVWDYYKEGRIDEIEAYNRDDVSKVRQIYKRLKFYD